MRSTGHIALAIALVLLLVDHRCAAARDVRTIALVGDSTTYGSSASGRSIYDPGTALEALLAVDSGPWGRAVVLNFGVGASNTAHWLADPPTGCGSLYAQFSVVAAACAENVSWIDAVALWSPDLVIVDLGLNDRLITNKPAEVAERLVRIRDRLLPIPTLFFPPIAPNSRWTASVRRRMEKQGLFDADYPRWLPTYDTLHLTDGGYAAKAGLWLDAIRRVP